MARPHGGGRRFGASASVGCPRGPREAKKLNACDTRTLEKSGSFVHGVDTGGLYGMLMVVQGWQGVGTSYS